jgi:hypothetical protein
MATSYEKQTNPTVAEIIASQRSVLLARTEQKQRNWQMGPRVSFAEDGSPRIRAFVLDEDAYMGYIEDSAYVGVAFMPDEVVIEVYYPYSTSKSHRWYSFNEATGIATKHVETKDTEGHFELPIEPTQPEIEKNAQDIIWYLRELDDDMVLTFEYQHQEDVRRQKWNGKEPFMFSLDQLK